MFDQHVPSVTILIVEDNQVNCFYLETIISKNFPTLEIFTAHDGKEAVALYQEQLPDIIILDFHMPIMNGDEAAIQIREYGKSMNSQPLLIGLTASLKEIEAFQKHVDTLLLKPVVQNQLSHILKGQLELLTNYQNYNAPVHNLGHYDLNDLYSSLGNDQGLIKEVLLYTLDYLNSFPAQMKELIERKDWQSVVKLAHQLRGTALNSRFPLLAQLAQQVELRKKFEQTTLHNHLTQIEEEIAYLLAFINEYVH